MSATPFPLGVFTTTASPGSVAANIAFRNDAASFAATMGAAPSYTDMYIDSTLPISQWLASANWDAWAQANTLGDASMTPVIGLPLTSSAPGSAGIDQSFQAWANGTYDGVLNGMVAAWAAQGFKSQVWRPGWEMNLTASQWYAGGSAQTERDFIAAFQHIYSTLHAAAQQHGVNMTVMWNPSAGTNSGVNATASLYPGDAYVDAVAADVYADAWPYSLYDYGAHAGKTDASMAAWLADPANRIAYWNNPAENQYSPDASHGIALSLPQLLAFTAAHDKAFAIAETGAGASNGGHDVADDAAFPAWLSAQLTAAQAAGTKIDFVNIWDSNDDGNYAFSAASDGKPQEAAAWANYFGAGSAVGASAASASPPPARQSLTVSNGAQLFASGRSDIVVHGGGGTVAFVQANGATKVSSGTVATPGPGWHAVSTGDFDGDGISDVLLQNDNGSLAVWLMYGGSIAASGATASPGQGWHAIATGDFSGNGRSAVLLQNDNGAVGLMQADGTTLAPLATIANPGSVWHAVTTGDFNGDGRSDIVLQNDDGSVAVWDMNGASIIGSAVIASPGQSARVVGAGDFDGDGKSGLVLQSNDGSVSIWTLDGPSLVRSDLVANPGSNWHVTDVGDFNGDGTADLLLQGADGTVAEWSMNGSAIISSGVLYDPGYNWAMLGQGGMNFIDGTSTTGTLNATFLSDDFIFSSPTPAAHAISGFDPAHDVLTLDQSRFGSYAAVQSHESQSGGNTMLDLGGGATLKLNGVLPSQLSAHNFI